MMSLGRNPPASPTIIGIEMMGSSGRVGGTLNIEFPRTNRMMRLHAAWHLGWSWHLNWNRSSCCPASSDVSRLNIRTPPTTAVCFTPVPTSFSLLEKVDAKLIGGSFDPRSPPELLDWSEVTELGRRLLAAWKGAECRRSTLFRLPCSSTPRGGCAALWVLSALSPPLACVDVSCEAIPADSESMLSRDCEAKGERGRELGRKDRLEPLLRSGARLPDCDHAIPDSLCIDSSRTAPSSRLLGLGSCFLCRSMTSTSPLAVADRMSPTRIWHSLDVSVKHTRCEKISSLPCTEPKKASSLTSLLPPLGIDANSESAHPSMRGMSNLARTERIRFSLSACPVLISEATLSS
mmetsp:Transcript_46143/g.109230  ORF Transcript_46143/g.109230 Transcript_46143/m.109230 type:complete len:349 (-) Transcript_46143:721-1767(-)